MQDSDKGDFFNKTTFAIARYLFGGVILLLFVAIVANMITVSVTQASFMVLRDASPETLAIVVNSLSKKKELGRRLREAVEDLRKEKQKEEEKSREDPE